MAPLTTMRELVTFTTLSTTAWLTLHLYVCYNGPIPSSRAIIKLNSWFYATVSFIMMVIVVISTTETQASAMRYAYHLSKFYEFLDILLVCASGGSINLHFGFHHLTTPYLTLIRFLNHYEGWRAFTALNTFHHVLMYTYFGGAAIVRPLLPWTGMSQLLVGLGVDIAVGMGKYTHGEELWPNIVSGCFLGIYLVLSLRDLRESRV
jgi:hypothetical protein